MAGMYECNGRTVFLASIDDALELLQREHPESWDVVHFIRAELAEQEQDYNALIQEAKGWSDEDARVWEVGRDNVQECAQEAEAGLELLNAKRLDRKKLRDVFQNIVRVWNNNY